MCIRHLHFYFLSYDLYVAVMSFVWSSYFFCSLVLIKEQWAGKQIKIGNNKIFGRSRISQKHQQSEWSLAHYQLVFNFAMQIWKLFSSNNNQLLLLFYLDGTSLKSDVSATNHCTGVQLCTSRVSEGYKSRLQPSVASLTLLWLLYKYDFPM